MNRAPDQLAPSRLPRQQRRRLDRALRKLFHQNKCSFCGSSFARKNGSGFTQLEKWLGEYDALMLRRNNAGPMVVLPWRTWAALLAKIPRRGTP
jgi:hypothetical protein